VGQTNQGGCPQSNRVELSLSSGRNDPFGDEFACPFVSRKVQLLASSVKCFAHYCSGFRIKCTVLYRIDWHGRIPKTSIQNESTVAASVANWTSTGAVGQPEIRSFYTLTNLVCRRQAARKNLCSDCRELFASLDVS
jgi:hypothetical protein